MVYIPESSGFLIGIILGCLIVGALYGLVPFFVGRRRDMNGLGAAGLICSMLGNLFFMGWGVFMAGNIYMVYAALFVPLLFTIIIMVKSR